MNRKELLDELINKQLDNIPSKKKLRINDLIRLTKFIDSSIFDENNCVIWKGYINNLKKSNKNLYVNFYFNKNKYALHRLLYTNFVGDLNNNHILKYICPNKGKCCNLNHLVKLKLKDVKKIDKVKPVKTIIREGPIILRFD